MRFLARLSAIIIILFIIPSTACAFWVFNLNRVAFNQTTYASVPQTPRISSELLTALLEGFTTEGASRNAHVVLTRLPPNVWATLAEDVLPTAKAKTLIEKAISNFFNWLDGKGEQLDVAFNLSEIKSQLVDTRISAKLLPAVRTMPPCSPEMTQQLQNFTESSNFDDFPICRPDTDDLIEKERTGLTTALGLIAAKLPENWSLADELHQLTEDEIPAPVATNKGNGANSNFTMRINQGEMDQFRASIRLQSRLLLLLFLIPIALLCVLIMVNIRSLKAFFRWIGWALVISGLISLLPVFLLPGFNTGLSDARMNVAMRVGTGGGQALGLFAVQIVQSIVNDLTLSVLFQVAALIVIGLLLVFISVLLPARHDELNEDEILRLTPIPEAPHAG